MEKESERGMDTYDDTGIFFFDPTDAANKLRLCCTDSFMRFNAKDVCALSASLVCKVSSALSAFSSLLCEYSRQIPDHSCAISIGSGAFAYVISTGSTFCIGRPTTLSFLNLLTLPMVLLFAL